MMDDRAERQMVVEEWVIKTFGQACLSSVEERVLRVVEEALELAQSEFVPRERIEQLLSHVWARPLGNPSQELGSLGITMLAYAAAKGMNCDATEVMELTRIVNLDPNYFRTKQNIKAAKGLAKRVEE